MVVIAAVVLAVFAYGVSAAILGTLLPSYRFTGAESGVIALCQSAGLLLASAVAGPVIDARGKKRPLVGGLALLGLAVLALPAVRTSYPATAALFFAAGFGGGFTAIAVNTLASVIGGERRSALLSFTNVFYGLGLIVTPWVSTLVDNDPARLCLFAGGLTAAAFAVHSLHRMPPEVNHGSTPGGDGGFQIAEARRMLGSPLLWLFSGFHFFYVACEVGLSNWLPLFLIQQGMPKNQALQIMAWRFGLGLLLGRVAAAPLLLRIHPQQMLISASVAVAGTTYWILRASESVSAPSSSIDAAVFCTGVAMAPVFPASIGMLGGIFQKSTSTAMSIVVTFGWFGLLSSSPLIGSIAGPDLARLKSALFLFPASALVMFAMQLWLRWALRSR